MSIKLAGFHAVNRNPETGVAYSIYHINNDLHTSVWDDIHRDGSDLSWLEYEKELRVKAARLIDDLQSDMGFPLRAPTLEDVVEDFLEAAADDYINDEPIYEGETDGIKWRTSWLGGAPHLIVLESPYYGVGQVCSPCVPNALNGSTVQSIFRDEDAAGCHASVAGGIYGYALPTTWLRDKED